MERLLNLRGQCDYSCSGLLLADHPLYESRSGALWGEFAFEDSRGPHANVSTSNGHVVLGQIFDYPPTGESKAVTFWSCACPLPSDPRSRMISSSKLRAKIRYACQVYLPGALCECGRRHLLHTRNERQRHFATAKQRPTHQLMEAVTVAISIANETTGTTLIAVVVASCEDQAPEAIVA